MEQSQRLLALSAYKAAEQRRKKASTKEKDDPKIVYDQSEKQSESSFTPESASHESHSKTSVPKWILTTFSFPLECGVAQLNGSTTPATKAILVTQRTVSTVQAASTVDSESSVNVVVLGEVDRVAAFS